MANTINIKIPASGAPSSTQGAVAPGGTVKFTNNANATASIDFGNKSPFCPQQTDYAIAAGKAKKLVVCTNYGIGGTYDYAVTVNGAETQSASLAVISVQPTTNPYVFPEKKPIVFPEDWVPLLIGLGVGAIVGYVAGKPGLVRSK
jgi:hypothetical protein